MSLADDLLKAAHSLPAKQKKMGAPQGERHGKARLSDKTVEKIRRAREEQNLSYRQLGLMFEISQWTARDIVTYRTRAYR